MTPKASAVHTDLQRVGLRCIHSRFKRHLGQLVLLAVVCECRYHCHSGALLVQLKFTPLCFFVERRTCRRLTLNLSTSDAEPGRGLTPNLVRVLLPPSRWDERFFSLIMNLACLPNFHQSISSSLSSSTLTPHLLCWHSMACCNSRSFFISQRLYLKFWRSRPRSCSEILSHLLIYFVFMVAVHVCFHRDCALNRLFSIIVAVLVFSLYL